MYEKDFANAHRLIDERYAMRYPGVAKEAQKMPVTWMSVPEFAHYVNRSHAAIYRSLPPGKRLHGYARRDSDGRWMIDSAAMALYSEEAVAKSAPKSKRILCKETGEIFPSVFQTADAMGVSRSKMSLSVNWGRPINGYHFAAVPN